MTKTTRLSCALAAVLHLTYGIATAADHPAGKIEVRHAELTAVYATENQSTREEKATQNSMQSRTLTTQEIPAQIQQEPDCD